MLEISDWKLHVAASGFLLLGTVSISAWSLSPDRAFHHYVKDVWSIEEGLPQITVNAIVQGPEGYIWAATQAGLARFDGARFTTYDPSNTPEIRGIFLQALFVDSRGRLWIGSYRGATVYENGVFRAVDDGFGRDIDVFDFAEDAGGQLFAATSSGLMQLTDEDLLLRRAGDPGEQVWSVFHHDGVLVAGGHGVIHHNDGTGWESRLLPGELASATVTGFAGYDGRLWAASSRGLLRLDGDQWIRFEVPGLPADAVVEAMFADRDGNFWISATNRLIRLQGSELVEIVDDDADYAHVGVMSMGEDHEGNLWLGSRWNGLARLWNGWVLRHDRAEGLHNNLVWSVARDDDGNLWTGTIDGLAVFRDGRFEQLTEGGEQPHPHAYTLLPERDRVWVGTRAGLFWWDRREGRIDRPESLHVLDGTQINGFVPFGDDIWLATNAGIWRWDGRRLSRMAERGRPGGQDVRLLHVTAGGELIAGTRTGLVRLGDDGFEVVPDVARGQDVTAIAELDDGRMVLGTLGERLWLHDGHRWHEFGAEDGLPVNSPFALGVHEDVLWVAGIRGIYEVPLPSFGEYLAGRIDRLPGRMVLHERGDIPGAQKGYCCNGAGNAKGFMEDGEFWLPTRGGVVKLVPELIVRNPFPPRVLIDRVRFDGVWHERLGGGELELSSDQRDLAFGISVLSFQDPGSVQVEYRLAGYDDRWQRLDEPMQRQVFYTNLPAGELQLEVRASNNAGVWTPAATTLPVTIQPRLWETTAFQLLLLFVLLLLIWVAVNFRLRKLEEQRRVLERTVARRTEELRIANEHLRDYSSRMETASMTDPLTGLWNRRYLLRQLPADLSHFHRELAREVGNARSMVFALVDMDHFKRVNDRHGHGNGDLVLQQAADRLRDFVRGGDYVVRWGGEEFLLVFRPMPPAEARRIARRLLDAVREKPFELENGREIELTCSVGMSLYPGYRDQPGALSWEDVVSLADKALYHAKRRGRNAWSLASPASWTEPSTLLRRMDEDLEQLIADRQVEVTMSRNAGREKAAQG